ncbi:BCCT family transporter [Gordonia sp. (in: high G+C Gram-positive bacteria)]|uniref:BCCT family transporter n=1 Tax=Gordonia sp. (in: high G+C Gram-positive bacteria) TaxID=84139 RepID=UPI0016B79478|nr:BCCT family transporter [Gordonia sp. (in: high G+C Gram-positive bacteria)]NLG45234.1 BCCT family transporter [Gordonia sp. (in: high G+C Gram-positive bacteria)]
MADDSETPSSEIPPGNDSEPETAPGDVPGDDESVLVDPFTHKTTVVTPSVAPVHASLHVAEDDTDDEITQKLIRQGVRLGKGGIAPAVFWPSLVIILAVSVIAVLFPDGTGTVFSNVQNWIVANLGWYYMLIIACFVVFVVGLCFSRLGSIQLGKPDEKPEFGRISWFCMLFAAGMGIGLVFYGVGEPLTYATVQPKPGWGTDVQDKAEMAMAQTFIHWGLHPWAVYAVIGLALAYAIHRRGRPVSIRWALEPLLGDRVKGWAGDVIDVLAICGTMFGVATSLGLGVQQIAKGMESIGVIDSADNTLLVILIVVITFLATLSVVSGLGTGIKWLSNINLSLAGLLMISLLLIGPTLFLLKNFVQSLGVYFANFFNMTLDVGAFQGQETQDWLSDWTIFYWGWWIAWAPFVGVFIARISRGRTVREFIAGCLIVPTLVGFIWFSVLGGTGLHRQLLGDGDLVVDGKVSAEGSLFQVLSDMPLGTFFSILGIALVAIFFITSSDSGSLVVDMLASGGHPNPPVWSRVLWAVLEGVVAVALLLAGGLGSLQAASLATALPFSIILAMMCVATVRGLKFEYDKMRHEERTQRLASATSHIADEVFHTIPDDAGVRDYLDDRIDYRISRTRGVLDRHGVKAKNRPGPGRSS